MEQREYNNEFKQINTKEKAYVLGLIMADGGLFYNKTSGAYQTKLKLKQSDKKLLVQIQNIFPFFTTPRLESREDGHHSYYIYRYNKQLFLDLKSNGILERKSYENANNVFLPKLSKTLFFEYVRGLFDGDGSIEQDSKGRIRIDVVGKNEMLFKEIIVLLGKYGIKANLRYRKDKDYHMIRISSKNNVKLFIESIATKNGIALERKFKPYFNIDWSRIPGFDNRSKNYDTLFVT